MVQIEMVEERISGVGIADDPATESYDSEDSVDDDGANDSNDEEPSDDSCSETLEDDMEITAVFKGIEGHRNELVDEEVSEKAAEKGNGDATGSLESRIGEYCTFDLRNLIAVNSHQIASNSLYLSQKTRLEPRLTIPPDENQGCEVDEAFLLEKATEGCGQLLHVLWQLRTDRSDAGPTAALPAHDEIKIPRSLVSGFC